LLGILGLLVGMAIALKISNGANNLSVPELAGRWTVTRMKNVNAKFHSYMWENLNFTIDPRGLLGNRETPFTMMIWREDCASNCYHVYDSYSWYGDPLYTLVRDGSKRLYLYPKYPETDSEIVFERVEN
jgi:hypothetical protein